VDVGLLPPAPRELDGTGAPAGDLTGRHDRLVLPDPQELLPVERDGLHVPVAVATDVAGHRKGRSLITSAGLTTVTARRGSRA
jgi:hypothetical protein